MNAYFARFMRAFLFAYHHKDSLTYPVVVTLLLSLTFCSHALAHTQVTSEFQQLAKRQQLAQSAYWHALMHYKSSRTNSKRVKSEIIDPTFFFSSKGAYDPEAELLATISALLLPPPDDHNAHASCRFIARRNWLEQNIPGFADALPTTACTMFDRWAELDSTESISLVFASGYLGNPASFYGHILLKFNSNDPRKTYLQHQSLNYGAAVPDQENPVLYIVKGLFGGYQSTFSYGEFYKNSQTYGEHELRDLWEYQLNLTDSEVKQLTFHAWELIGHHHDYYFLKENCAFRMAQLLELIIDAKLKPDYQPWAMPISVFQSLDRVQHHGQPLIKSIRLHPSRQRRFYQKYQQLTMPQQQAVRSVVANDFQLTEQLSALEPQLQSEVLEALFDYLEYAYIDEPLRIAQKKPALLQARLSLPVAPLSRNSNYETEQFPHQSTRPSMLQLQSHTIDGDWVPAIRFRAAYYDLLTAQSGQPPFSALSMFDVTLSYHEQQLRVQQFELLNIEQMNLSTTGLPADAGMAWQIKLGYRSMSEDCLTCRSAYASSGIGKAYAYNAQGIIYGMVDATIHPASNGLSLLHGDFRLGTILDIHPAWRSQLEFGWQVHANAKQNNFLWYRWQHRFGSSPYRDLRVSIDNLYNRSQFTLAYSHYW